MKIEITKRRSPLADFFSAPLSVEGEAELQNLQFVDELIALMKEQGISRVELARRLAIQPSRVTAMLSGQGNFTTQTKVRAARAVNAKYHHCLAPASKSVRWQCWEQNDVHPAFHAQSAAKKEADVTFEISGVSHDDNGAAA
jgi:plasmid maintenance system antidote protein VapI